MENNPITNKELLQLLRKFDELLDTTITLIAVGGTSLTLQNIKDSTRDIDFCVPTKKELNALTNLFTDLGFKPINNRWITNLGVMIDLFSEGYVFNIQLLDDYIENSTMVLELNNISIKAASVYDIIIMKLGRGDLRDFDDIKAIYEKNKINNTLLIERYFTTTESSPGAFTETVRRKILDLFEVKFKEWNFTQDERALEAIRKWNL